MSGMSHLRPVDQRISDLLDGSAHLRLNLFDAHGQVVAHIQPLVRADADDAQVVQALTDWRNANMKSFFGHFVATPERTRLWMLRDLFGVPGKLLFMIHCQGRMVGHYGFKDLHADEALLDNAMLGERCQHPGVMKQAALTVMQWLFEHAQVKQVWAEVLTTNAPALMLNRQLGFAVHRKLPMRKEVADGQVTWTMGDEHSDEVAEVHCYKLLLTRDAFIQQAQSGLNRQVEGVYESA